MRLLKLKKFKRIHGLYFTPDGTRLLVVGGAEVRMVDAIAWLDPASGAETARFEALADCTAVSADLSRLAAVPFGRRRRSGEFVQLTDPARCLDWQPVPIVSGSPSQHAFGLAFDPGGTRLAFGWGQQRKAGATGYAWTMHLSVWNIAAVRPEFDLVTEEGPAVIAFSPDGERIAFSGGIDGDPTVCLHSTTGNAERLAAFRPKGTRTRALVFDPAGRLAVVNARMVYLLSADLGEVVFALEGHPKQVNAAAFTADGRRMLTAAHDGSIRTWDTGTGAGVRAFDWGIGPVTAVTFAPDGLTCAAAGKNGQVVVWDVDG